MLWLSRTSFGKELKRAGANAGSFCILNDMLGMIMNK